MGGRSEQRRNWLRDRIKARVPQGARILEVSCGAGSLLAMLRDDGYRVAGTNYTKHPNTVEDLDIHYGIDLQDGLPYEDASFDCVLLLDVIEHLNDHDQALSELSRVCKPGGLCFVLTPNITKISSRVHFLTTGFFKVKRAFIGYDVRRENSYAFHNNPPHLPVFLYQMKSHGFEIKGLEITRVKPKAFLFLALLWPIILGATYIKTFLAEPHIKSSGASGQLFRIMTSFRLLCGESWMLVGERKIIDVEQKTQLPRWAIKAIQENG